MNLVDVLFRALLGNGSLDDGVSVSNEIIPPVVVSGIKVESVLCLDISNDRDGRSSDNAHVCFEVICRWLLID